MWPESINKKPLRERTKQPFVFRFSNFGGCLREDPKGEFVSYYDYKALLENYVALKGKYEPECPPNQY